MIPERADRMSFNQAILQLDLASSVQIEQQNARPISRHPIGAVLE